jgi:tellurite resistance protein TehA-like permease
MIVDVGVPVSRGFIVFAQVLFWIDVVLSLLTCFGVPLYMYFLLSPSLVTYRIMYHEHSINNLTAIWLLPVVAPIIASATGANICTVLTPNSPEQHAILVTGYALWGLGTPFAASILVLYIYRLTVYKVSSRAHPPDRDSFRRMKSS